MVIHKLALWLVLEGAPAAVRWWLAYHKRRELIEESRPTDF